MAPSAALRSAATFLAPPTSQSPFAWWIRLPRSVWAAIATQINHESRIHHDKFRMMELVYEGKCLRGLTGRVRRCAVPGRPRGVRSLPYSFPRLRELRMIWVTV